MFSFLFTNILVILFSKIFCIIISRKKVLKFFWFFFVFLFAKNPNFFLFFGKRSIYKKMAAIYMTQFQFSIRFWNKGLKKNLVIYYIQKCHVLSGYFLEHTLKSLYLLLSFQCIPTWSFLLNCWAFFTHLQSRYLPKSSLRFHRLYLLKIYFCSILNFFVQYYCLFFYMTSLSPESGPK